MLDDFFTRALLAGIGVALVAGPLGCFIIWRRMAYFGDTISHSALLGVALAFLLDLNIMLGVFAIATLVSLALLFLQARGTLSSDAILGILSHSALALGMVALAFMSGLRVDLMSYLFGDILAVSATDLGLIYGGAVIVLVILAWIWRPLLAETASLDIARAEGLAPERARWVFMLLVAAVIALSMKAVGILLVTALLIIPAATARAFTRGPEPMALAASGLGIIAVIAGLAGSLQFDTPSGPSIVVAALIMFLASLAPALQSGKIDPGRAGADDT